MNAELVSFTQHTSTGVQSEITVGFRPTFAMFWVGGRTSDGETAGSSRMCMGATDGTRQLAYGLAALDVGVNWSSRRIATDRVIVCRYHTGGGGGSFASEYEASFDSFTSTGVVLNVNTTDSGGRIVHMLALDGCNAFVGTTALPTSTTTFSVTGVGFKPTAIFAIHPWSAAVPEEATLIQLSLGFVGRNPIVLTNAAMPVHSIYCNASSNTDTSRSKGYTSTGVPYGLWRTITSGGGSIDEGALVTYDNDGGTFNAAIAHAATRYLAFIAFGSCQAQELAQVSATGLGKQSLAFGKVATPRVMFTSTTNRTAPVGHTVAANALLGIGVVTRDSDEMTRHYRSQDNLLAGVNGEALNSTTCIQGRSVAGTLEYEAQLHVDGMSEGVVPLDWTTVAATGRFCNYLCLGDNAGEGGHPQILAGKP